MIAESLQSWERNNEAYLAAAVDWVRGRLEWFAGQMGKAVPEAGAHESLAAATARIEANRSPPPALSLLADRLGLTSFETQVLVLCAAMELDTRVPALCARAQDDPQKSFPTFALALAALDDPAWDIVSADRPLRHWRLIEVQQRSGAPLTASPLAADMRIVSYLKGLNALDGRLTRLLSRLAGGNDQPPLPDSQQTVESEVVSCLERPAARGGTAALPVIQLLGVDSPSKQAIALRVAAGLDLDLWRVSGEMLRQGADEVDTLARLWERECRLLQLALYVEAPETHGSGPDDWVPALRAFLARTSGLVFLDTRESLPEPGRSATAFPVARPTRVEQRTAWAAALGDDQQAAALLSGQFDLNLPTIQRIAAGTERGSGRTASSRSVWAACRDATRPRLDGLAQPVDAKATWDDIVLPDDELQLLHQVADQVRQRDRVYEQWGYRARMNRGLGISACFAGDSGVGKTMGAEVIANELQLDLIKIDLSAIVNKYIGETEKNLKRVFDAAEQGGCILFFDEADALFGKRSEIKDSHDRYANIEVNYLLQRMETYRGLAILATNMKGALDKAFLRRIRFVVDFPFPAAAQRKRIWQRAFPAETPCEPLDFAHLARLKLTGGNIHIIALNAAFAAAANGGRVTMSHVLDAARCELRKLQKPINAADLRWQPVGGGDDLAGEAISKVIA